MKTGSYFSKFLSKLGSVYRKPERALRTRDQNEFIEKCGEMKVNNIEISVVNKLHEYKIVIEAMATVGGNRPMIKYEQGLCTSSVMCMDSYQNWEDFTESFSRDCVNEFQDSIRSRLAKDVIVHRRYSYPGSYF